MDDRDRIFISYSHKDRALFAKFIEFLKTAVSDEERLQIWSDEDLDPGQDWQREIELALERTAVAVPLVSNNFFRSKFIVEKELPVLLAGRIRDELHLTALYLEPSDVHKQKFTVPIPGAGAETVTITQYQGLNPPGRTVDSLDEHERKKLFVQAARRLRDLAGGKTAGTGRSRRQADRYDLAIRLERRNGTIRRTYSRPDLPRFLITERACHAAIAEADSWRPGNDHLGDEALFDLLLGSEEQDRVDFLLAEAFETPHEEELPRPTRGALRIRLQTEDTLLRKLPWKQISYDGALLRDSGWTVELSPTTPEIEFPEFINVVLRLPGPVLCIVPHAGSASRETTAHARDVRELFQRLWPKYVTPPTEATTRDQVKRALAEQGPRIVYYYGPAETVGTQCRLLLTDDAGNPAPLDLESLASWLGRPAPAVLFLNLLGESAFGAISSAAALSPTVPFVAVLTSARGDSRSARMAAFQWLETMLTGEEDTDPVWALGESAVETAGAWAAYDNWKTVTSDHVREQDYVELLLDRRRQRERVSGALNGLVHDFERRLLHFIAYGEAGNKAERFPEQLMKHLRQPGVTQAHVHRTDIRLQASAGTADLVDRAVRQSLGLRSGQDVLQTVTPKTRSGGTTRHIPLLVWQLEGSPTAQQRNAVVSALLHWIQQHLAARCPRELRLLSLFCLEMPRVEHESLVDHADSIINDPELEHVTFEAEVLGPLDDVELDDLRRHFRDRLHCNCPDTLRRSLPPLIYEETKGRFEITVDLLNRGETGQWHELQEELQRKHETR